MKRLLMLISVFVTACEREPQDSTAVPGPAPTDAVFSTKAPTSPSPKVVPLPKDQAQLDRMILAGYTPHMDHLDPPGANECPLTKGTEVVM